MGGQAWNKLNISMLNEGIVARIYLKNMEPSSDREGKSLQDMTLYELNAYMFTLQDRAEVLYVLASKGYSSRLEKELRVLLSKLLAFQHEVCKKSNPHLFIAEGGSALSDFHNT